MALKHSFDLKKLRDGNFEELDRMVARLDRGALAESIVPFCKCHRVMGSLIELLLKREIARTNHPSTLFREDSFLNNVLNRILYADFSYLHSVLKPIVVKIVSTCDKDPAAYQIKGITQERKIAQNQQMIMELLDEFLVDFKKTIDESPRSLLESLRAVYVCVNEKFGSMDTADRPPLGVDVLFFKLFCPAVIDPVKFEMVSPKTKIPTPTFNALLTVSKILNDLALGNMDKWTPEINAFLKEKHRVVKALMTEMLEHAEGPCEHAGPHMEIAEIVSEEEVETATTALDDLIWDAEKPIEFNTLEELKPLGPFKAREMKKRIERLPWKLQKEKGSTTIKYHIGQKDIGICASTVTSIPIAFASKWAPALHRCPELSEVILSFNYLIDEPDFFVGKLLIEVGPLTPRCAQYAGWIVNDVDGTIYKPTDGLPDHLRTSETGTVKLETGVAGWVFEPVSEYQTRLTYLTTTYSRGMPVWMIHLGLRSQTKSFMKVLKLLEESWRNPHVLDVLKKSPKQIRQNPDVEKMTVGDAPDVTSPESQKKKGLFTPKRTKSSKDLKEDASKAKEGSMASPEATPSPSRSKSRFFSKKPESIRKVSSA
eukprot:TRINITY_DN7016_c3_g1_i1.p1 TRINITY_DN7016_c3_g1~~TRINITY_DN7016_c3_g1_i1.p1  ORF type:complete len:598 (+),score=139.35 TRINITY_DN7016_c3_g1_i1:504-2297(+)